MEMDHISPAVDTPLVRQYNKEAILSPRTIYEICNSDTIESRDRIGTGFGVAIVTAQHGKRVLSTSCQRPIAGRVYIRMIRAFLWYRESPKGCSLT